MRPLSVLTLPVAALLFAGCGVRSTQVITVTERAPLNYSAEHEALLAAATPGQSIRLEGVDLHDIPEIKWVTEALESPQFFLSDDPEYIREPEGVAARERVEPGIVRVYTYNVNGVRDPEMPRKINTTIRNLSETETLTVRFHRFASHPPSANYFAVGKNTLATFLRGEPVDLVLTIPPHGSSGLDPSLDNAIANFNDLVHGLYEFEIDQPAEISVIQIAPEDNFAEAALRDLPLLSSRGVNAGRGLFSPSNLVVTQPDNAVLDTADGVKQLIIADGVNDPWVAGVDGMTGQATQLAGNYGVMYEIIINRTSSDGRGLALVTWNARKGSPWCDGMANAMRVSKGLHPAGVYLLPSDQLINRGMPEVVVVQVFPPVSDGETETITMTYSPPGASCLPTPLIFIPIAMD